MHRSTGRVWAAMAFMLAAVSVAHADVTISLNNIHAQLGGSGQPTLVSLGDTASPQAYTFSQSKDLWALEFFLSADANGKHVYQTVTPSTSSCTSVTTTLDTASRAKLAWQGCTDPSLPAGSTFTVTAHATLTADGALAWTIAVNSQTPMILANVVFPRLEANLPGTPASMMMSFPYSGGWLLPAPLSNPVVQFVTGAAFAPMHGDISMQWFSVYDQAQPNPSLLFFGTRDGQAHYKEIKVGGSSTAMPMELRQTVGLTPPIVGNSYSSPYPFVLTVLRGDWYTAAMYYRSWALTQPWMQGGSKLSSTSYSSLIKSARVIATNTGDGTCANTEGSCPSLQHWSRDVQDQKQRLGLTTLPQLQYNWQHGKGLGRSGIWLPLKPETVTQGKAVKASGDPWAPYFFNLSYNANLPSWTSSTIPGHLGEDLNQYCVKDANQNIKIDGNTTVAGCILCSHPPLIGNYSTWIAGKAHDDGGAQGIYFDILSGVKPVRCYDPTHGHPLGGGDFFIQGLRNAIKKTRDDQRLKEPQFFVFSEGQQEMYVDLVEVVLSNLTDPGPVFDAVRSHIQIAPLYESVYGDFQGTTHVIGQLKADSSAISALFADQAAEAVFRRHYGAHVFFGHIPAAGAIIGAEDLASVLAGSTHLSGYWAFVESIVNLLKVPTVADYFYFGRRLRDPQTNATLLTRPANDRVFMVYDATVVPQVMTTARKAADGSTGILVLNWTASGDAFPGGGQGGNATVDVSLNPAHLELPAGKYHLMEVSAAGQQQLGVVTLGSTASFSISVPERGARFVRFVPWTPPNPDAGVGLDSGVGLDAGVGADTGVQPDSGVVPDSGSNPDTFVGADAGGSDSVSADSGSSPDAGGDGDDAGGCSVGGGESLSLSLLLLMLGWRQRSRYQARRKGP